MRSVVGRSAGIDCYRIAMSGGSFASVVAGLAEGMSELVAQTLILFGEFPVAAKCDVEALAQRVFRGALPSGRRLVVLRAA